MSRRRTKVDTDRPRETDTQMDCHHTNIQFRFSAVHLGLLRVYSTTYMQARAWTELRTKRLKLWNASYNKGKKPTTTTSKLLWLQELISREVFVCVFVNLHLWPQVTDNSKLLDLGIWTPTRVIKLKSQRASHYACVQHLFSDRRWYSMNRENQLLVTNEPVEVQHFRKTTDINIHTSKSKIGT